VGCGAHMGLNKNDYRILVGKPDGMRLFGRPVSIWKDDIKMDLK